MKRLVLALVVVIAAAPAVFAQSSFQAILSGANEVPPADPDGSGTALVTITGTTVTYSITVNAIAAPTAQHIHTGVAGVNGPVLVALPGVWTGSGDGPWVLNGATTTTAGTAASIIANPAGFYVNVHNATFPGGAVRGQLAAFNAGVPTLSTWLLLGLAGLLALTGTVMIRRF